MKTYDLIKKLLQENIELRNDDQLLQWKIWEIEGSVKNECMYYSDFKNATSSETLRRTRQKIQQNFPKLGPNEIVKNLRSKKQQEKGMFVYRSTVEDKPRYVFNSEKNCYTQV